MKKLRNLLKMWYGPKHIGWTKASQVRETFEGVAEAQMRLHTCGNLTCGKRPLAGSMFCESCVYAPTVKCVRWTEAEMSPKRDYGGKFVVALSVLLYMTTLNFTRLEVQYSVMFDKMLVGTGKRAV